MKEWYRELFNEDYLTIYNHRSDGAASEELIGLLEPLKKEGRLLDLCCGTGRHSRFFKQLGYDVVGVDLSSFLLSIGRSKRDEIVYLQEDMREIHFSEEFDLVVNLFTSFGYFEEDEENEKVIQNVAKALKVGGQFVLDYFNPTYLKNNIVPYSAKKSKTGELVEEFRTIEKGYVEKEVDIGKRRYKEKIKIYRLDWFERVFEKYGLNIAHVFGDYDKTEYTRMSPRMIILAEKKGE